MQLQLFLFPLLSTLSFTQAQFSLTSDGCVDASGFDSCMSSITTVVQQCIQKTCNGGTCESYNDCQSADSNCYPACICGGYQSWINCGLSHCWNRAYSCEFQDFVIEAVGQCDSALTVLYPPYYPAPAGQPGGCSCQIGAIYDIIEEVDKDINKCTARGTGSTQSIDTDCDCCGASKALSSFIDVCRDSDLTTILPIYAGMTNFQSSLTTLNSTACNNAFAQGLDCTAANLGFQQYNNSQFYAASNLPDFGSDPVTDLPGQLETPLASTLTWSFYSRGPVSIAVAATGSGSVPSSVPGSSAASAPKSSAASSVASAPRASSVASAPGASSIASAPAASAPGPTTTSPSTAPPKASGGESQNSVQMSLVTAVGGFVILALLVV